MTLADRLAEGRARFDSSDEIPDAFMPDFLYQHIAKLMHRMPFCVTPEDEAAAREELARSARRESMAGDAFDAALKRRLEAYRRSQGTQ